VPRRVGDGYVVDAVGEVVRLRALRTAVKSDIAFVVVVVFVDGGAIEVGGPHGAG